MGLWVPTSQEKLASAESAILRCIQSAFTIKDVLIEVPRNISYFSRNTSTTETRNIHTISFENVDNNNNQNIPLVMVHGFGSGLGLWILNYDSLSQKIPLHTLDLPGFGRSSRNFPFASDAETIVDQYVDFLEKWRCKMGLKKFVLLGHSFGAYLSYFYTLKHHNRVQHLILADPWGMIHRTEEEANRLKFPWYLYPVVSVVRMFNPLSVLRATGPLGSSLVPRLRGDILYKFRSKYNDNTVGDYIYHCNAQYPCGETAFSNLCQPLGWPSIGMLSKVDSFPVDCRVTMIYGEKSWMSKEAGEKMYGLLKDRGGRVKLLNMPNSSHHVYADDYTLFNNLVCDIVQKENALSYWANQ